MATMKAWHFCSQDRKLRYGDNRIVKTGRVYRVDKTKQMVMCGHGLHASRRIIDALEYAESSILCRVKLCGKIVHGGDKSVAYARHVLAMADIDAILHEFACRCAERALRATNVTDERCWRALAVKRQWLAGNASDEKLAAARDAARAAAWAAAGAAAGSAAGAAAGAAAWAAAGAAARAAARDAAGAAAGDAARAAARKWQERTLLTMLREHTHLLDKG